MDGIFLFRSSLPLSTEIVQRKPGKKELSRPSKNYWVVCEPSTFLYYTSELWNETWKDFIRFITNKLKKTNLRTQVFDCELFEAKNNR